MAVWQYDFIAVPRTRFLETIGGLPTVLTVEQLQGLEPWCTSQPIPSFETQFERWQTEMKSWSPQLRMWGSEQSNRVDVFYKDNKVKTVQFRVELRSLDTHFINIITSFARKSECLLVSLHSLSVIDPVRENVLMHLCRSPGANRVLDLLYDVEDSAMPSKYRRVFLSHSSIDKPFVSRLAADLVSRRIPVWFDQWELKVGDSLTKKIEEGISESGWLAVVLSKNSANSSWVQKELQAAQARELRDKDVFVLPLVIDDCEIPLFLLDKLYADFRGPYEYGLESLLKRVVDTK